MIKKYTLFNFILLFLVGCSYSEKNKLEEIFQDSHNFQIKEKPLYTNLEFWYDLQSKDTPYTNFNSLPSMTKKDIQRRHKFWLKILERLQTIDIQKLSKNDRINYNIFNRIISERVHEVKYKGYLMPINTDSGFHTGLPRIVGAMPFQTKMDYQRYTSRLNDFPRYFDEQILLMKEGLKTGITIPKEVLNGYEKTISAHIVTDPEKSLFFSPFKSIPKSISSDIRSDLIENGRSAILEGVVKAYTSFYKFFKNEYQPGARTSLGASALPNGKEYYEFKVGQYSTLNYTPVEVHQMGLIEVERIKKEMEEIINKVGFEGGFQEFLKFLRTDKQFYAKTPEQLLKEAAFIAKRMEAKLPSLFKTLPKMTYGVAPVPKEIAPNYTAGRYVGPAKGSNSPGYYLVNTFNLKSRPLYNLEALTFHEAVPGHHLQISISDELENVPFFRNGLYLGAYSEGWSLYSEWLGLEAGFYTDPYSDFGRLTYEMWRACRMVVDTGIHSLGWSRQQSIDYLSTNTALPIYECTTETDRYISWPGQALGYKIGQMKIKALRDYAEQELQEKFDVRTFHDAVLWNGSVPLDVLEKLIYDWINNEKALSIN